MWNNFFFLSLLHVIYINKVHFIVTIKIQNEQKNNNNMRHII